MIIVRFQTDDDDKLRLTEQSDKATPLSHSQTWCDFEEGGRYANCLNTSQLETDGQTGRRTRLTASYELVSFFLAQSRQPDNRNHDQEDLLQDNVNKEKH